MECRRIRLHRVAAAPVALLLLVAAGCQTSKKPKESPPPASDLGPGAPALAEMRFDVDPTLLGFTYADSTLGLRFAPPRGWPPLEPDLMDATKASFARIAPQDDRLVSRPVRIFYEKDRGLFLILSEFSAWPAPLNPYLAMTDYRRRVAAAAPSVQIQDAWFRHGPLAFYQLQLENDVMMNFRLMVIRKGHAPVQVDYLIPKVEYDRDVMAIEASIGSIQPL